MATYKQRVPLHRHGASGRHSPEDPQTTHFISASVLARHAGHDLLDQGSDQEWTSIRNTVNTRARARQQQYFDQQQQLQRTRDWQLVLGQHHTVSGGSSVGTGRGVSSDEYDEVATITEPPSALASPRAPGPGDHSSSSAFGFSDLTSDSLESLDESEDVEVWSHHGEEDSRSLSLSFSSIPPFPRPTASSSPLTSSSIASLSHLPRPSFGSPPSGSRQGFQNQMPLHDGSGNFFNLEASSPHSLHESDLEWDLGWESAPSVGASQPHSRPRRTFEATRRRISSSDFNSVIQNIAKLQIDSSIGLGSAKTFVVQNPSTFTTVSRANESTRGRHWNRPTLSDEQRSDYGHNIMDSPTKAGWLQVIEQALRMLQASHLDMLLLGDSNKYNPIKLLAYPSTLDDSDPPEPSSDSSASKVESPEEQKRLKDLKEQMSASSMNALQQLQMRHGESSLSRFHKRGPGARPLDPMQVEFTPTVMNRSPSNSDHGQWPERRQGSTSRSTGTSTSPQSHREHDSNMLVAFFSTLRRIRDHVHSNFLSPDFYDPSEEEDRVYARRMGFEGDLGIEWATGAGSPSSMTGENARRNHPQDHTTSANVFSKPANIRRISSDCGLESMRHRRARDTLRSHRPRLVE